MRRFVGIAAMMLLITAGACTPPPSPQPFPDAGCYSVSVPGGWGSVQFSGLNPTPANPYNFQIYAYNSDCDPGALSGEASGVNAVNELDAFGKCLEQAGFLTYPDVTAATIYRLGPEWANVWMCFPVQFT